jgi:hypothetical protein
MIVTLKLIVRKRIEERRSRKHSRRGLYTVFDSPLLIGDAINCALSEAETLLSVRAPSDQIECL